jgi:hypothetical protein
LSVQLAPDPIVATLRLLPAPQCEPPFDDEISCRPTSLPGQLALPARQLGFADPPPNYAAFGDQLDDEDQPKATARSALPDPRLWAARFAQAMAEVLAANRPARQLIRWTSWPLYERMESMVGSVNGAPGAARPVLRSLRVSEPADGVAEACAVLRIGGRFRALALRFEGLDGRWQCTAAEVC